MEPWDDPGKYLGLPSVWGRSRNQSLAWIKERVLSKMDGWKERFLNQAGKAVLIKAVIQSISSYAISVVRFPKNLCDKLSSEVARFWWRKLGKPRGIHWKRWGLILVPKDRGGMGFRDFFHQNSALLARQAWRILENPDALWVRVLKNLYFPNNDFLHASPKRNSSWSWASILQGRKVLIKGGIWRVGDGQQINIFKNRWLPQGKPKLIPFLEDYSNIKVQDEKKALSSSSAKASKDWRPPPLHVVKFNCDASFNSETKSGVVAVVARDHEGLIVAASSDRICAPSALVAEALAFRAGTVLASNCDWPFALIESDNLQVIEGVRSNTQNWDIQNIIMDIKQLSSYLPRCGFLWANQEANRVAHELAAATTDPSSPRCLLPPSRLLLRPWLKSIARELKDPRVGILLDP
ncbi:Ribonuclease H-like superfamily [Sesbania bispinosa]|nr:Ribonuclease H-like superfamily [Sesbania bispinosa]